MRDMIYLEEDDYFEEDDYRNRSRRRRRPRPMGRRPSVGRPQRGGSAGGRGHRHRSARAASASNAAWESHDFCVLSPSNTQYFVAFHEVLKVQRVK